MKNPFEINSPLNDCLRRLFLIEKNTKHHYKIFNDIFLGMQKRYPDIPDLRKKYNALDEEEREFLLFTMRKFKEVKVCFHNYLEEMREILGIEIGEIK